MLKSDSTMYQIPLPISPHYRILNINRSTIGVRTTIMIPIDEEEEKLIDNIGKETLHFTRGNRSFSIQMRDIYCYGEVDFTDKNTLNQIEDFKFLSYLSGSGIPIYACYNYKTHSCTSFKRKCLWTETWSSSELAKMAHGYLGKPQRILLFNQTTKK